MRVEVLDARPLRFADGAPVRAASGIARLRTGWLVVQDDATLAASWDGSTCRPVRLLPPVDGLDVFDEASGTKALKPDLEAAVTLPDGTILVLGSGSSPARTRSVHLRHDGPVVHDLSPVYDRVTHALGVAPDQLNLEGACILGEEVRWFQRGLPSSGIPTASVDVRLDALVGGATDTVVGGVRRYDLGTAAGVGLAVTDAVALADGLVLVSAAAEDSPTTYDDGPVVGSALALLDDDRVVATASLPGLEGGVAKVEGLGLVEQHRNALELVAVVDADDPHRPSILLRLWVTP